MRRPLLPLLLAVLVAACLTEDDEMALPASRDTTYAAGSQVKSADLNDIQDRIVNVYKGTDWIPAFGGSSSSPTLVGANAGAGGVNIQATGLDWIVGVPVTEGETITITAYFNTTGTGGSVNLQYVDPTTHTVTVVGTVSITGTGDQSAVLATNHAVVAGRSYYVQLNPTTGGGTGFKTFYSVKKVWARS